MFKDKNRSYVAIWEWIQHFGSLQIFRRKRVTSFIIDETIIQIGNQHFGYGYVLNHFRDLCLESIYQNRETCL
ncbi:MAG: hypothetical protein MRJ93_01080 [Nitrososphaeraceae archaeon]|nr:hypothetical protein [Nitrososphaeraceae archaeon]